jgi:DNA modification methylase
MFPEKLAEDHILSWSKPGDIVLDPMCGAGTTLKMAAKHQRSYLGIDISETYCELSKRRVTEGKI